MQNFPVGKESRHKSYNKEAWVMNFWVYILSYLVILRCLLEIVKSSGIDMQIPDIPFAGSAVAQ